MELHQTQDIIAADLHRFRVLCCGRRFGKTTLAIEEIKGKAISRTARIAYIATTYAQARDIAWELLKKEMQGAIIQANESRLELKVKNIKGTESLIVLRGWENIETLRGLAFDFVVIDEVASMRNFWLNWQEVIRPTLTDTRGEGLFISTPKGFNHFYELYNLENEDEDFKSFHFTSFDNPFIPSEELEKAKQEITEDRFAQEYLADFRKTEGLVFKEFDRKKHLFEKEKEDWQYIKIFGGVDFGFTNPTAVMTIKKDKDNNYWITDEWYKTQKTDAAIADYVASLNWNECYPDPESASGIKELENRKVNIREVIKNKDSIRNGISVIRELFKSNRLKIHTSCRNLIWEIEIYSYPEKKDMRNEEENPIKENDHAIDAIRYALSMEQNNISKGVKVLMPNWKNYNQLAK